jgi:precorrin-2 dehydrogenase
MSAAPRFHYPVCLDLGGRPCVVVGGGAVAERKVRGLLDAGACVTVLSPRLTPGLLALAGKGRLQWRPREYRPGDLTEAWLVMVATDDRAVNGEVAKEARARRVWANCADDPERCDFALPAIARRGTLTVAVSTGGASPALAQMAREEIERRLPAEWETLGEVAAIVRRELRARGLAPGGARWRAALDGDVRALVAAGRAHEARQRLRERLGA